MEAKSLFSLESPVAARQPKTDRLVLASYLKTVAGDKKLDQDELKRAHQVLLKWAELESSGRLARLNESQMQGDFLAQVFGEALGYDGPLDGAEVWHREQHYTIAGQVPDTVLGLFRQSDAIRSPLAVVELKGPKVHLDRDRSNGRTAVDQCWDYLVNTPITCRWGIVSNFVSFRLYERDSTKRRLRALLTPILAGFQHLPRVLRSVQPTEPGRAIRALPGNPGGGPAPQVGRAADRSGGPALRCVLEEPDRTHRASPFRRSATRSTPPSKWPSAFLTELCSSPFVRIGGCSRPRRSPRRTRWPASTR